MKENLRIAVAQLNFLVGDIEGNRDKVITNSIKARDELKADLVAFPEMALTGYPPDDLLLRSDLYKRVDSALQQILNKVNDIYIIVGYPGRNDQECFNQAAFIYNKKILATYRKQKLPNYGVFDEERYFQPGREPCGINLHGVNIAITICEDLWYPEPMAQAVQINTQLMISINSSPFDMYKPHLREQIMSQRAKEGKMPIIYVNTVGGQDELVFDGGSMVLNSKGEVTQNAGFFKEAMIPVDFGITAPHLELIIYEILSIPHVEERIYKALVLGVRDYIEKNHFPGAVIGLSGGVDSALTLAIAVDAIGKDRVEALSMPSHYTRKISMEDSKQIVKALGVKHTIISIEPVFKEYLKSLAKEFAKYPKDITEENIQARCRAVMLMAISNKRGSIVLSTGNKSEMAVGYATLYGDMVGGFCVLKDVPKTFVYRLVAYRNKISQVIPNRVITRKPSAELAANQFDQDVLPPYDILDAILERYVEKDQSMEQITNAGFDKQIVKKVLNMVDRNEYKRRQAPPGIKITARAFGRDRRYPITSGYSKSDNRTKCDACN
ncbi:MAG: NAD synthetase [Coxiella sp. DG_40]|nr:MAG: NAD synthetase [Coxiella sp. DG_40]